MSTIEEIEHALSTLSIEQKYALYRILEGQLTPSARHAPSARSHSVLDIAPVRLGTVLQPIHGDDDLLDEMLEGRA